MEAWDSIFGVLGTDQSDHGSLDTAHAKFLRGAAGSSTPAAESHGRSPKSGDHLSGRQTRKHVRGFRSCVPAAMLSGVLGNTWGLLG